jgi:amino acid adenylation domain-containing protein
MNWNEWHKHYDSLPSLQERLRIVREQIAAALDGCPPGPVQIVSICAGDGRDLLGALENHPRRNDVAALLLDNNAESIARGKAAAEKIGLTRPLRFLAADATLAKNYLGAVPADLVLLSGFLGHLRHEDVPGLIGSLPMFCKSGGQTIWNRHLVLHDGREQVPLIRELFRKANFEEIHFSKTDSNGFAVGRARFCRQPKPLDPSRVLFEFVGLDRLLSSEEPPKAETVSDEEVKIGSVAKAGILAEAETSIPARFRQMAELHPSRMALGGGVWQPTYAELDIATNRFANILISNGGKAGDRAALLMRHDTSLIAAALAVLKAGRIVVVLNPTDPPMRLKQILDDAEPGLIVTDSSNENLAGQIAQKNQTILPFEKQNSAPAHAPEIKNAPTDIAWLIYTSGSTGQPKGVMQTHRNIAHNVLRLSRGMDLSADDRIILLGSPSGGQGVATTWCALLNGATLFPVPMTEKGATGLKKSMLENKITVYVSTTSVFRSFATILDDADLFPNVRLVRFGSEPAAANDFANFKKHFSEKCVLLNSLSSSETGNITQHRFTQTESMAKGRLSVGRPATGMEVLLLDENGREVRDGETGEIFVRSHYLSPGYWRNELLTAERFSKNGDGVRIFRSGDLGRRLADGSLMFMDRKDARIKIHGYRVELSEIEDVLAQPPEVENVFVSARTMPNGNVQLVAYVILRAGRNCTAEILRHALRQTLPTYMIPAHFIFLEKFPLTPHGKIDRGALPPPAENKKNLRRSERPRDLVESRLAKIWQSALGISPIGRHDDFFNLGGTSLQSVEVLLHIEEAFGAALPPSILTEHSTVEKLAALISGHVVIPSPSPLVLLQGADGGRPLFLVHSGQGDVTTYGPLARRLPGRPVYGLQSVGLHGESWPLMSVPAMAQRYLSEVISEDPTGPYLLGASCMGGMVAFEMAQMLVRQGREVALLALFDVRHPHKKRQHHKLRDHVKFILRDPARDALRILRWAIFRTAGLGQNARSLPAYRRFVAHMNSLADRRYRLEFYSGAVTLFVTEDTKFPDEDLRLLMRRHARESKIITLPDNRSKLFIPPTVDELAQKLQACLELAENKKIALTTARGF